jgi:hypothetical protein
MNLFIEEMYACMQKQETHLLPEYIIISNIECNTVRPGPTNTRTKQAASDEHTLTRERDGGCQDQVCQYATNRWMDLMRKKISIIMRTVRLRY